jgi:hypothetical protein
MKEAFKEMEFLNYEYLLKEHWWSYDHDHEYKHIDHKHQLKPENKNHFKARLAMFLLWFIFRNESNGCAVSHSKVFKTFHAAPEGSKRAKHGGYYLMEPIVLFDFLKNFLDNNLQKETFKKDKQPMTKEKKKKYAKINSADYYFEAALKK